MHKYGSVFEAQDVLIAPSPYHNLALVVSLRLGLHYFSSQCLRPLKPKKYAPNWTCHTMFLKNIFKDQNFDLESFSIRVYMWKLWACKVVGLITWQNQEFLEPLGIPKILSLWCITIVNHRVWAIICHLNFAHVCFIHAPFWLQFVEITFFLGFCKFISPCVMDTKK